MKVSASTESGSSCPKANQNISPISAIILRMQKHRVLFSAPSSAPDCAESEWRPLQSPEPNNCQNRDLKFRCQANVRFGSKADISVCPCDVRLTPKSGHR